MLRKKAGKIWFMLIVFVGTSVLPFCVNAIPISKNKTSETPVIYSYDAEDSHWLLRTTAESEETSSVRIQVALDTTPLAEFHGAEQMVKIAQIVLYEQTRLARQFIYILISVFLL